MSSTDKYIQFSNPIANTCFYAMLFETGGEKLVGYGAFGDGVPSNSIYAMGGVRYYLVGIMETIDANGNSTFNATNGMIINDASLLPDMINIVISEPKTAFYGAPINLNTGIVNGNLTLNLLDDITGEVTKISSNDISKCVNYGGYVGGFDDIQDLNPGVDASRLICVSRKGMRQIRKQAGAPIPYMRMSFIIVMVVLLIIIIAIVVVAVLVYAGGKLMHKHN